MFSVGCAAQSPTPTEPHGVTRPRTTTDGDSGTGQLTHGKIRRFSKGTKIYAGGTDSDGTPGGTPVIHPENLNPRAPTRPRAAQRRTDHEDKAQAPQLPSPHNNTGWCLTTSGLRQQRARPHYQPDGQAGPPTKTTTAQCRATEAHTYLEPTASLVGPDLT